MVRLSAHVDQMQVARPDASGSVHCRADVAYAVPTDVNGIALLERASSPADMARCHVKSSNQRGSDQFETDNGCWRRVGGQMEIVE